MSQLLATESRLTALRQCLKDLGVQAFIQPRADEYLGEYVPEHNERLWWLTGFTGSAGFALVGLEKAAIFVDGRYTIQVKSQVSADHFSYQSMTDDSWEAWLAQSMDKGSGQQRVGYDPRMHTASWAEQAQASLAKRGLTLVPVVNPIDSLWLDRPEPSVDAITLFDHAGAGATSLEKRQRIGALIAEQGADVALITALDSIAWLLNIRGQDIPCLPVVLGAALINSRGDMTFFLDTRKLAAGVEAHVGAGVSFAPEADLAAALSGLKDQRLLIDSDQSNAWAQQLAKAAGATLVPGSDPVALPKACKNAAELAGMREAHIRDAVAVCRYLAWLDAEVTAGRFHDEGQLADKLLSFRKALPEFRDTSFDTISAVGGNAAMCHYSHLNGTPAVMPNNSLYLVDSGGQYPDGTTDITRTVAIGQVTAEMKRMVTLVLKGHIALSLARFPKGTTGHQLDALARQFLWAEGFDYDHGTGHGVGHFLNVHEGPQRIGKSPVRVPLMPGMVCSNEPGYYRDHAFGIRIENLVAVQHCAALEGSERETYEFEVLTLVPLDTRLFDLSMLTAQEIEWVNNYHLQVAKAIAPRLSGADLDWLVQATRAIG
ncbi:aminopeptidase P family protein [Simiduia curdlanivorans]|uniref:Aminopeptidase P family protein n=1 Tax=Simiduia curdlanivorans TaxID=1492769 RepID=A0ABV8V4N5_9GAMM|nr:aminopeptidase P family protein [Simiduia curdlanivorans]MDN3640518.1 aminopeptidase P family protein [Simiduia curdlanivorans]